MNEYDSSRMADLLQESHGLEQAESADVYFLRANGEGLIFIKDAALIHDGSLQGNRCNPRGLANKAF